MQDDFQFRQAKSESRIESLKKEWIESLPSPQDGMWESFRNNSVIWEIENKGELIGYACVDDQGRLLQFYLVPAFQFIGPSIFEHFIKKSNLKTGIVGTQNLTYLSIAINYVKEVHIDSYLFRKCRPVVIKEKEGKLSKCRLEDKKRIVDFYHETIGAPRDWLNAYLGDLIPIGEIFVFENKDDIFGVCEVRTSKTDTKYADIGMIVSQKYRKAGYGTFLLHKAKSIALEWGKIPICSCEKTNIGSLKSITNCGFVSRYQLLSIQFEMN